MRKEIFILMFEIVIFSSFVFADGLYAFADNSCLPGHPDPDKGFLDSSKTKLCTDDNNNVFQLCSSSNNNNIILDNKCMLVGNNYNWVPSCLPTHPNPDIGYLDSTQTKLCTDDFQSPVLCSSSNKDIINLGYKCMQLGSLTSGYTYNWVPYSSEACLYNPDGVYGKDNFGGWLLCNNKVGVRCDGNTVGFIKDYNSGAKRFDALCAPVYGGSTGTVEVGNKWIECNVDSLQEGFANMFQVSGGFYESSKWTNKDYYCAQFTSGTTNYESWHICLSSLKKSGSNGVDWLKKVGNLVCSGDSQLGWVECTSSNVGTSYGSYLCEGVGNWNTCDTSKNKKIVGINLCDGVNWNTCNSNSLNVKSSGYVCLSTGWTLIPVCGNKKLDLGEACDDGNFVNSDGCSTECKVEQGFTCSTNGLTCVKNCVSSCTSKQCGTDGCSGSCGTCNTGFTCSTEGKCVTNEIESFCDVSDGVKKVEVKDSVCSQWASKLDINNIPTAVKKNGCVGVYKGVAIMNNSNGVLMFGSKKGVTFEAGSIWNKVCPKLGTYKWKKLSSNSFAVPDLETAKKCIDSGKENFITYNSNDRCLILSKGEGNYDGAGKVGKDDVAQIKKNPNQFWESSFINKDLTKLNKYVQKMVANWGK